jgi:2',3'-cyclic-nucleotide 2'-phosphodiesterase (5'-nucleotidase family)
MRKNPSGISFFLLLLLISCHSSYQSQSVQYNSYRIEAVKTGDTTVPAFLSGYREEVNRTMNAVVGTVETTLEKKQPEGTLGNFIADAMLIMARQKFDLPVDAAFVNYGGIRLNQLASGNATTGKIYELMPFDNILVLQKMKGDVLQQFLDIGAARGGWPVAGLTMQISNKKAVNIKIAGKPLDPSATYTIANSDYVANGGDNADMLRAIPQISNGYLVRDAIFDYIKWLKSQGKNIVANLENRVSNVE